MIYQKYVFIGIFILKLSIAYSQETTDIWQYIYEGQKEDSYIDVIENSFGDIVAIGNTTSKKLRKSDVILHIFDSDGNVLREKNYGSNNDDYATKVLKYDDKLIVIGQTDSKFTGSNGLLDAWIFMLDNKLNVIWSQVYGGEDNDGFIDVTLIGNRIVAAGYQGDRPIVVEYNLSGDIVNAIEYETQGYVSSITTDGQNIWLTANSCSDCDLYKMESYMMRIDPISFQNMSLTELDKTYINNSVSSMIRGQDLIILGNVDLINSPRTEVVLAIINVNNPDDIVYKEYGDKWDDIAYDFIDIGGTKGFAIAGKSKSFSKSKKEFFKAWVIFVDDNYEQSSYLYRGTEHDDGFNAIEFTSSGSILIAGGQHNDALLINHSKISIDYGEQDFSDLSLGSYSITDDNNNQIIDAGERAEMKIEIQNTGAIDYSNLRICIDNTELSGRGVTISGCYIIDAIAAQTSKTINIYIDADEGLQDQEYVLRVTAYDQPIGEVKIKTQQKRYIELTGATEKKTCIYNKDASTIDYTLTCTNIGNVNTDLLTLNMVTPDGVVYTGDSALRVIEASTAVDIPLTFRIESYVIAHNPTVHVQVTDGGDVTLDYPLTLDLSELRTELRKNEKVELALRIEKETQRIEALKESRRTEIEALNSIKKEIKAKKQVTINSDDRTIDMNLQIAELEEREDKLLESQITAVIEDYIFIQPYISDAIYETYDDYQDIIMIIDYEEDLGFQQIKLSNNGQVLEPSVDYDEGDASIEIIEKGSGKNVVEYRNRIRLQKGDNNISFVANYNDKNYQPKNHITVHKKIKKIDLQLISIGIPDITQEESYRLKYTSKDAADFISLFEGEHLSDYFNLNTKLLNTTEETTTDNIRSYIQNLNKDDYKPDDIIMFYISSHAFYSEDFNSLFVSTSDYDYMKAEVSSLRFNNDILDWLKRLPCNVILLLDICHSGSIINESETAGSQSNATSQIINYLDRSRNQKSNVNVISSSGAGEYSYEVDQLSNSAFMAAIKDAVMSTAHTCYGNELISDIDNNNTVQLDEFVDYVRQRVPCIVDEHIKGQNQNPEAVLKSAYDLKIIPALR